MSGAVEHSGLQKIKYINFKNEITDQTSEIIILPMKEKNKSFKKTNFKQNLRLISICIVTLVSILIGSALYFKIFSNETCLDIKEISNSTSTGALATFANLNGTLETVQTSRAFANQQHVKEVNLTKKHAAQDTSIEEISSHARNHSHSTCVPLHKVEKVILTRVVDVEKSHCWNDTDCNTLLQQIEQKQNGSRYNFVVGKGGELYVGLGFRCLMDVSESALFIKYLKDIPTFIAKQCLRITEVIDHGVSCGYISKNFTLLYKDELGSEDMVVRVTNDRCSNYESQTDRSLHFHDPDHEMRTLVHGDIKWTVCGNFSHTMEVKKSRVITLESLSRSACSPLENVNEIFVEVTETEPFNCSDDSSCSKIFEEQHDGFNFNFIIGHNLEVYVGLGFRCQPPIYGNVLRIKVLEEPNSNYLFYSGKHRKFVQILHEAITCGIVLEDFSVSANCYCSTSEKNNCGIHEGVLNQCASHYQDFQHKRHLDYQLHSTLGVFDEDHYNISSSHGTGIVPGRSRFSACNKKHPTEFTPFEFDSTSELSSETMTDTVSHEVPFSHTDYNSLPDDENDKSFYDLYYSF